jgi:microcystin-dependent protein
MAQPYVGEIRMFAGNFAPAGWMFCEGQLLPISENDTLFMLIGTTYGGDGQSTFGLPDLRGRVPVHQGQGAGINNSYTLADQNGVEEVTLTTNQMPIHNHALLASNDVASQTNPQNNLLAQSTQATLYIDDVPNVNMAQVVGPTGGSQPHSNFQPYLCVDFIISLFGLYPSAT